MGYSKENLRRVAQEYEGKNLRAKEEAERKKQVLHREIPELAQIDAALSETGLRIMSAASRFKGEELEKELAVIRKENLELQSIRAECLKFHGLPTDITDVKYECPICSDTGFVGLKMCQCRIRKLTRYGYESSGLGNLIETQTFDSFRPEMQNESPEMSRYYGQILESLKNYASHFKPAESGNLLFLGGTGLGKTHLSTAIASGVIDLGYDVVYETAANLFSDFEFERFGRSYGDSSDECRTERYFECDLLIVDDLGTEVANQFTKACLYNLLNTRLNRHLSTLISTNLSNEEIRKTYTDRIASRLFGEFRIYQFRGQDVRMKKVLG